jgi:hypothetical protein
MPGHLELLVVGAILLLLIGIPLLAAALVIVLVLRSSRGASQGHAAANLIPCPDCGRGLSPLAESCPGCGRPVNRKEEGGRMKEEDG